jgi:hypothetical protein
MRHPRLVALFVLASLPALASSSISDELSMGTTQSTPENPRAGNVADSLNGTFELNERWSLTAGATVTLEGQTPAAGKGAFGTSGQAISLFSVGADWDPNDHVTFGATLDFSPESTQRSGTQLAFQDPNGVSRPANALLNVNSSQAAVGLDFGYDTAGESALELSFSGGVTLSKYSTTQTVSEIRFADTNKPADRAQIIAYCNSVAGTKKACSQALRKALQTHSAELDSARFSLGAIATLATDTDVGLTGEYYVYQQDPTAVGYFSVGAAGRQTISGGTGVPLAPLQYLVRPEVAHRFGDFSAKVWVQAGAYVAGAGQGTAGVGTRLQYKVTRKVKLWVTASGQRDVDLTGASSNSGSFALGAAYRF